ncbi:S-layer homology domain-containing protein [Sinanaerobacter sp. ZZT-01]|uniref:S-layer homology domain-containing protein n=1 Tax=Sinanaerobacter sp. ZZT-01 TaxID=3111540 RepID=UPI002D76A67B|nr:S-layer homology domain-containing protein [Sinanaerobacter sp. ZZT-01]WRR93888.1 S-layer homology domain-containing protein [Sinanaerobacter sp. ZZT-01]
MSRHKTKQRIMAMMLSAIMVVGMMPVSAFAETSTFPIGTSGEIIAFEVLRADSSMRSVSLATNESDLKLPKILTATIRLAVLDEETVLDSGETDAKLDSVDTVSGSAIGMDKKGDTEAGAEAQIASPSDAQEDGDYFEAEPMEKTVASVDEITVPLPVTWVSFPAYDGETAGEYIFMPELPEGISIASGVEKPTITVTVGAAVITGTVTAFDDLTDEIRWQNTTEPEFPEAVGGTVGSEAAQIPVTWEADHDYDEQYPQRGLYVFTAVLGEGYVLADGVELPRITVFIPVSAGRMVARMAGGGTTDSPLEITTAAQLAEIATLVNARENGLELFLFNNAGAKVSLKMTNDIDLSAYTKGEGWEPIGNKDNKFRSAFDGGGHKISNLTINRADGEYQGLFGSMGVGALVENLGIENTEIRAKGYAGGVAGEVRGGTVQNCYTTGSVGGNIYVGGVLGVVFENSTVQNCYSTVSIDGASGTFSFMIGGLTGGVYDSTVINCYATGNVSGSSSASSTYTGGLTGYLVGESRMQNCAALNPAVSGRDRVGRVVGSWPAEFPVGNSQLSGNIAFGGMTVTKYGYIIPPAEGADQMDGEPKTAADISAAGFFEELFGNDTAWTYETGKLPGFGAAVEMPEYLVNGSDPNFFGAGTSENPYQINTPAQLAKLAELVNEGNASYNAAHYKLMNNLDLSAYGKDYDDGKGWTPIGNTYEQPFKGIFDGNGKTITELYINQSGQSHVGLFGSISRGTANNLALQNVSIKGGQSVGGVTGSVYEGGMVQGCFVSGIMSGADYIGGVVGHVHASTVQNCYSAVSLTSTSTNGSGGVIGRINFGTVKNCYSIGSVAGIAGNGGIGGVVGVVYASTVQNCAALNPSVSGASTGVRRVAGIFDSNTLSGNIAFGGMTVNGATVSGGTLTDHNGAPKTAAEIAAAGFWTTASGFTADWDTTIWDIEPGKLPILKGIAGQDASMPAHLRPAGASPFEGAGTSEGDPYLIKTAADLAKLAELVNAGISPYADAGRYYKLVNNLDLSDYGAGYDGGKGWIPIGTDEHKPFNGIFNGGDYQITGLYITRSAHYQGLFGYIGVGSVKNLGVANVNISGIFSGGGLAGRIYGTVENCYVSGSVSGIGNTGGMAGWVFGTMQSCYVSGNISATNPAAAVGGVASVVGEGGTMQNCYSTGSVSVSSVEFYNYIGGVVGIVSGTVQNCYSTSSVSSTKNADSIGGVMGTLLKGTVQNCAALNPSVSSSSYSGRVVGNCFAPYFLYNNYAFSRIPGTWANEGLNAKDGEDVTSETLFSGSFWTTAGNWNTAAWDSNVWTFEDGKLPTLKGLAGQNGDGGLYMSARDIQYATVGTSAPLTYNGSEQIPTLTVTFDGETLTKNTDYTVSITSTDGASASAGINAGEVTLTLTGIGSFKGIKTATYTIGKAPLTISSAVINPKFYDSTITAEVANVSFDGLQPTETLAISVDYTVTGARYNSADAGDNKTVTATVTLANSATAKNYSLLSDVLSISGMTIGKADFSSVDPVNKSLLYSAAHTNVTVNITGLPDDRGTTTFTAGTVAGDTAIVSGTVQGTATGIKFSTNAGDIGQTAIIPVTATMQNYKDVVVDVVVTLVNKTPVTITGVTVANKVYDGTAIAYTGTPANAQGYIGTYQYVWSSGSAPKDAGNYTLTVKIPDSNADFMGEIEIPFIISPATVTITAKDKIAYVGGTAPTFGESDYTVTGLASGETLNTTPTLAYTTTPDMSKTGTYTIIATDAVAPDSSNYNSTITYITGTLTIRNRPSGGGNSSDSSSVIVTPPAADKPNSPTQGEIKVSGTVDGNGNVTVNITAKAVTDAFENAMAEARKNGTEQNGITVVLRVNTGNRAASSVTVNLPKSVQDTIIGNNIVSVIVVVDNPDIRIGMDLATIQEINKQAKSDVNITATRMGSGKLTGDAKKAIGSRPVFELRVNYGSGKQIQSFGAGSVSVSIPYILGVNEKAGNVQAVYVDAKGKVHWLINSVYDHVEKVLRFSTSHFSTYGVGYKQTNTAFTDIAGHWAKEDIEFVVSRGLFSGTSTTTFSPNTAMTRGMFVTALGRLANADVSGYTKSSFTDVKGDAYYMGYIEWASKNNIVNGVGNGRFAPDQSITREQMAVIMQNYAKIIGFTLPKVHVENTFADSIKINAYAKEAVKQMQMAGVISGKNSNLFDPQGTATRAEVSAVLRRFVELAISSDTMQGWAENDSGKWMYYENGKAVTGKKEIDGSTYTFDQYGVTSDVPKNLRYTAYTIQKGDSFWSIARKLNCTMDELERLNNKSQFSIIHPGDVLRVPEK